MKTKTENKNSISGVSALVRNLVAAKTPAKELRAKVIAAFPKMGRKSEAPWLSKRIAVAKMLVAHTNDSQN